MRRTTKSMMTLYRTALEVSIAAKRRLCESPLLLWFKLALVFGDRLQLLLSPASQSRSDCCSPPLFCACWRSGDRSPFKLVVDNDELVIVYHRPRVEMDSHTLLLKYIQRTHAVWQCEWPQNSSPPTEFTIIAKCGGLPFAKVSRRGANEVECIGWKWK